MDVRLLVDGVQMQDDAAEVTGINQMIGHDGREADTMFQPQVHGADVYIKLYLADLEPMSKPDVQQGISEVFRQTMFVENIIPVFGKKSESYLAVFAAGQIVCWNVVGSVDLKGLVRQIFISQRHHCQFLPELHYDMVQSDLVQRLLTRSSFPQSLAQ